MESTFLDELLEMAEQKELMQTEAYYDLLLAEIKKMRMQIEYNFNEAEKEVKIINKFVLKKNTVLDERIKTIERKLEMFIREKDVKSISLANGTLKMHKKQDRIEIIDMETFLKYASKELLDFVPESYKASITKIKQWIKFKPVPKGVTVVQGKPEFSYTLNNGKEEEDVQDEEIGTESKRKEDLRIAV